MALAIGIGFPLVTLFVMYFFRMYTLRNFGWVLACLLWGALGYGLNYLLEPRLLELGLSRALLAVLFVPLIQQLFVALGVFLIVSRIKLDNLVDGAVYGVAAGLGYAILENVKNALDTSIAMEVTAIRSFSTTLVLATACGIIGVVMTQFYFRHQAKRVLLLLGGLGIAIVYSALFNLLVALEIGGEILPIAFGIGGITVVGLYVTGQLRKILIQLAIEKQRANNLLEIVIPIGVQLSTETNYGRLLEKMLVEAKSFCKADAGTLYLIKEGRLDIAVVRNDTLRLAMGGTTANEITLPALELFNENGEPNHRNVVTHVALSGETVNLEDAYESTEYDFSMTKLFDRTNGYQSISMLIVPLKYNEGSALGVLQLVNALNSKREILPFDKNLQKSMESFSALACAALEGYIHEQSLRKEIQQLRIEIDAVKRSKQVEDITNTDYFKNLQEKSKTLRQRPDSETTDSGAAEGETKDG